MDQNEYFLHHKRLILYAILIISIIISAPCFANGIVVHENGNVGISTETPETKLDIVGMDVTVGNTRSIGAEKFMRILAPAANNDQIKPIPVIFSNNGSSHQNIRIGGGTGGGVHTSAATEISFFTHPTVTQTEGTSRMTIKGDGKVGIGSTTPAYTLDVNGTIRGNNVSPSDARWKTNVQTIDNPLEKISRLRGVTYEWIEPSKGEGNQIGVIAQEVEVVFPEAVSTDNQGYKSVAYGSLVAPLIEAVKTLKRENDKLQADNEQLKKDNEEIKKQLAEILSLMKN